MVSCGLDRGRFLLSDVPFPGSTLALLKVGPPPPGPVPPPGVSPRRHPVPSRPLSPQRPPFCPAKRLGEQPAAAVPAELRGRGVAAGVAVLLRDSTGRILLTRRAPTLSIFPSVWVPPGESAGWGGGDTGCGLLWGYP